jgi:hypothetical protein
MLNMQYANQLIQEAAEMVGEGTGVVGAIKSPKTDGGLN